MTDSSLQASGFRVRSGNVELSASKLSGSTYGQAAYSHCGRLLLFRHGTAHEWPIYVPSRTEVGMAAVSSRASEHPLQTIAAKMKSYDVHRSVRVVEKCSFNVHVSAG